MIPTQQQIETFDPVELLNEREAARLLGYTPRALQKWRMTGGGPRFVRVSARSVRYRRQDLDAWIRERLRQSTSDLGIGFNPQ